MKSAQTPHQIVWVQCGGQVWGVWSGSSGLSVIFTSWRPPPPRPAFRRHASRLLHQSLSRIPPIVIVSVLAAIGERTKMSSPTSLTSISISSSLCATDISTLFAAVQHHDELADISLLDLTRFIRRAYLLKDDILQPQPHTEPVSIAPEVLPPSITTFLSRSFNISVDAVDCLWEIVKDLVWTLPSAAEEQADEEASFKTHGHPLGLSEFESVVLGLN